jgi:hypothetical protein
MLRGDVTMKSQGQHASNLKSKIQNLKSFEATFCLQPASIVLFYNRLKAVGWAWIV